MIWSLPAPTRLILSWEKAASWQPASVVVVDDDAMPVKTLNVRLEKDATSLQAPTDVLMPSERQEQQIILLPSAHCVLNLQLALGDGI